MVRNACLIEVANRSKYGYGWIIYDFPWLSYCTSRTIGVTKSTNKKYGKRKTEKNRHKNLHDSLIVG